MAKFPPIWEQDIKDIHGRLVEQPIGDIAYGNLIPDAVHSRWAGVYLDPRLDGRVHIAVDDGVSFPVYPDKVFWCADVLLLPLLHHSDKILVSAVVQKSVLLFPATISNVWLQDLN